MKTTKLFRAALRAVNAASYYAGHPAFALTGPMVIGDAVLSPGRTPGRVRVVAGPFGRSCQVRDGASHRELARLAASLVV